MRLSTAQPSSDDALITLTFKVSDDHCESFSNDSPTVDGKAQVTAQ
jgi:hypothetical protein